MATPVVLCYHAVSPTWEDALAVSPDQLREQVRWLADQGYEGRTFTEVVQRGPDAPGKWLSITFDDAYRSVAELAFPILEEAGFPATVFLPTAFMGTGRPMAWAGSPGWLATQPPEELIPMSWQDAARLSGAGWEMGSHSRTHPRLPELDERALADEVEGSRQECEARLGLACTSFCYPYGALDDRVTRAVRAAGYAAGAALDRQVGPPEPLTWPRIGIYRRDSTVRFRIKLSSLARSTAGAGAIYSLSKLRRLSRRTAGAAG